MRRCSGSSATRVIEASESGLLGAFRPGSRESAIDGKPNVLGAPDAAAYSSGPTGLLDVEPFAHWAVKALKGAAQVISSKGDVVEHPAITNH